VATSVYHIPVLNLLLALLPLLIVCFIYFRWSLKAGTLVYATLRMLFQLVLIGFLLTLIFEKSNAVVVCLILAFMLAAAGWIALRTVEVQRKVLYFRALLALVIGCVSTLVLIIGGVIQLKPWHEPTYIIPLAGMIFANAMNSVSLAAERFHHDREKGMPYPEARSAAFQTSLIPITNTFFAVGLVALPGMMTGQILAGVPPLIAIRYQIMVMAMLMSAAGISSAVYLRLMKPTKEGV